MSVEIEARFSSSKGELMLIAWFEGAGMARFVATGPAGEREEVPVTGLAASMHDEAKEIVRESQAPKQGEGPITARIQLSVDGARAGRTVRLGNKHSRVDQLCKKLVQIADLLSNDPAIKRALGVLRQTLKV